MIPWDSSMGASPCLGTGYKHQLNCPGSGESYSRILAARGSETAKSLCQHREHVSIAKREGKKDNLSMREVSMWA